MNQPKTRTCGGGEYPIIANLSGGYDLVAHPNGPAIIGGDCISTIDIYEGESLVSWAIKIKANAAYRKATWPLVKEHFSK